MTRARTLFTLAALVCAPLLGACRDATAQAKAKTGAWEHGVFEYTRIHIDEDTTERYRWSTAAGAVEGSDVSAIWSEIGVKGNPTNDDPVDQAIILNWLSKKGWELVNGSDASFALAGGTVVIHRYYLRRPA